MHYITERIKKNNLKAKMYRFIRTAIIPWVMFSAFLYIGLIIITN